MSNDINNDISTMYTKNQNQKAGRKGYGAWKIEKETVIPSAAYVAYILQPRKRGKNK